MAKTTTTTQEYVGCILSMIWATAWDNSVYAEVDEEDPDFIKATRIVNAMMEREITKNDHRRMGAMKHLSEIKEV